jgi:hypothetical protein
MTSALTVAAATRVSLRADAGTVASMLGAVIAAVWLPGADLSGSPWLGVLVGTGAVATGLAARHWAARALWPDFTRSVAAPERVVFERTRKRLLPGIW